MPGNRSWHLQAGLGPTPDQLFMQSNFGIVTKMGVWLMPMPETYMPLWLRVWSDDDLAPMFETLRKLMLDGTIRMVPQVMNTVLYGAVVAKRADFWTGEGPIPDDVLDRMARDLDIGRWLMRFALYEDEAVADLKFAKIKRAFESAIPGAEVSGTKYAPEEIPSIENPAEKIQGGIPNLDWNAMTAWYGGEEGGHIGFSPVAPLTGPDSLAATRPAARNGRRARAWTTSPACCPSTPAASSTSRWSSSTPRTKPNPAPPTTSAAGWWWRRPSSATASTAPTWTSWTSPPSSTPSATTPTGASARPIKDALDPNGILSSRQAGDLAAHPCADG